MQANCRYTSSQNCCTYVLPLYSDRKTGSFRIFSKTRKGGNFDGLQGLSRVKPTVILCLEDIELLLTHGANHCVYTFQGEICLLDEPGQLTWLEGPPPWLCLGWLNSLLVCLWTKNWNVTLSVKTYYLSAYLFLSFSISYWQNAKVDGFLYIPQ
jgi:hypothetical protein